jgi:hypothetical protein
VIVVGDPLLLRLVRPYADERSFVAAEGWTLTRTEMLLIDEGPLAEGTLVRFDVELASGKRLVRAEGRVTGFEPATADKAGGTRVRFRRFGASTKDFIDRVMAERGQNGAERSSPRAQDRPERPAVLQNAEEDQETGSGVRTRLVRVVPAPPHREDLLARLRERFARRESSAIGYGK